jgi:hypothetical protein
MNKFFDFIFAQKRAELDRLKDRTKCVDAKPLMELCMSDMTEEEGKQFIKDLKRGSERAGIVALERAYAEGLMTKTEWTVLRDGMGFDLSDIGSVLTAHFHSKEVNDTVAILTMPYSATYKNRDFVRERFKVEVITAEEMLEMEKREHPEEYAQFEKEFKEYQKARECQNILKKKNES